MPPGSARDPCPKEGLTPRPATLLQVGNHGPDVVTDGRPSWRHRRQPDWRHQPRSVVALRAGRRGVLATDRRPRHPTDGVEPMRDSPTTAPLARRPLRAYAVAGGMLRVPPALSGGTRVPHEYGAPRAEHPLAPSALPRIRGTSPASSSRPPASSCLSSDGLRVQQPAQLETAAPHRAADVARAEIHRTLRTSAQTVLGNIGTALDGISSGQYGRCLESGDGLSPSGSARFRWPPRRRCVPTGAGHACAPDARAEPEAMSADETQESLEILAAARHGRQRSCAPRGRCVVGARQRHLGVPQLRGYGLCRPTRHFCYVCSSASHSTAG